VLKRNKTIFQKVRRNKKMEIPKLKMQGLYLKWGKIRPLLMYSKMPLNGLEAKIITIGSRVVYSSVPMDQQETSYFLKHFEKGLVVIGNQLQDKAK
jgi:hypothetical protein